jgi:hypothetical protein
MGNSLFEQLKKTGLVNKTRAQQAKRSEYVSKKNKSRNKATPDETRLLAQQALKEKTARDRAMNQQQQARAEKKALAAQITQLIDTHRVTEHDGEIAYNFTDGKAVKRIYVSEQGQKLLMAGHLAIARHGEGYALVPAPVAEKIKQRDTNCIITLDATAPEKGGDDPYADYVIPDDLMW